MTENSATINVYKCPTCGGAVRYSAAKGTLVCSWCDNTYEAENLQVKEVSAELTGYQCPECGAQLMADDFIAADTCPYCGNNEIAPQRFEGEFEPDYIIPFTVSKTQAVQLYEKSLLDKEYLPDDYQAESRVISVQGTYVPFWLFTGTLDFDFTFYTTHSRSGKNQGYDVRPHHFVGTYDISRLPADGSERMADDMMDSLEPYDYSALTPFTTDCIPGFVAERPTVHYNDVVERVRTRVGASAAIEAGNSIKGHYNTRELDKKRFHTRLNRCPVLQAQLPVWLLVVLYHGEKYLIGVNGQTGKVAVNLPVNEEKQVQKARKEMVARSWFFPLIMFAPAICFFAYPWYKEGHEVVISTLASALSGAPVDEGLLRVSVIAIVLLVIGVGSSIWYFYHSYKEAKEEVRKSMQNVEESIDASRFGTINITLDEEREGPLSGEKAGYE